MNRGAALLARAAADGGEQDVWQGHLDAGHRQLEALNARYAEAKNAEAEARRAIFPPTVPPAPAARAGHWMP